MTLLKRYPRVDPGLALLACALLTGLSGCASLRSDYDPPVVTITSFRPIPSAGAVPGFEIGLRVVNPNLEPLQLQGIAYTITLADRKLITGVGNDLPVIDGYSEGTFTVTAAASLFESFRLINDLMNDPRDVISYEVETKLDVGTFTPAIRVKNSGEISLQPK